MHQYPKLAQKAIEAYVIENKTINPTADLTRDLLNVRSACFVSLHTKNGALRGCIGTILPTKPSLAQEIIANAISAATQDPRFPPMSTDELTDLDILVDVLSQPEQINDVKQLDPKKYGVIIRTNDSRSGLLLPDLDGVDTIQEQVDIAAQKGGIDFQKDKVHLYRFTVQRYK